MNTINIGIFAHIDAGKTTLTEQILYLSGLISSPGTIEEGTTESDILKVEIERGISVVSSILQFECKLYPNFRINLIDTPGHLDFRSQVEAVLPGIDLAIVLVDGTRGVESQTLLLHEELKRHHIPEVFFINKLDKSIDSLSDSLVSIEEMLGATPPILFREDDYSYIWKNPERFSEHDHMELIQWSEIFSSRYLNSPESIYELSREGLLEGVLVRRILPVLGGSAYFGKGVLELLEFVYNLSIRNKSRDCDGNNTSDSVIIIKRIIHPDLGRLTIAKANADLESNSIIQVYGESYRLGSVFRLFGMESEVLDRIPEGEIFASSDINEAYVPYIGEDPNYSVVVEPDHIEDREELVAILESFAWEDPSYRLEYNQDSGNYQIWGRGELHLDILRTRLEEIFRKKYRFGNISVARYELLKKMVKKLALEHTAYDEKLSSGKLVANLRDTADFSKHTAFEVSLPEKIRNAIETGFHEALSRGNYHLEVLGALLTVESYDPPSDITEITPALLKVAVVSGIRNAIVNFTDPIGPVADLEIEVADGDVGNVLSLLQKREAKIFDIHKKISGKSLIIARAGTENLLGFSGALRNMTRGTGISYQRNSFNPENYIVLNEKVR